MAKGKGSVFIKITLAGKREGRRPNPVFWIFFPYRSILQFSLKKECLTVPSQQLGQKENDVAQFSKFVQYCLNLGCVMMNMTNDSLCKPKNQHSSSVEETSWSNNRSCSYISVVCRWYLSFLGGLYQNPGLTFSIREFPVSCLG